MKKKHTINQEKNDDLFHVVKLSSEYDKSTIIGKLIFLWQWRFFFNNFNKSIKLKDIPKGRSSDGAEYVYNEFQKYWQAELKRAKRKNRKPNLVYPIFQQYGLSLVIFTIFCLVAQYAVLVQSLYLDDLIRGYNQLNDEGKNVKQDIVYTSVMMVVLILVHSNFSNVFHYFTYLIALRVRICLSEFIYRKSLRLSKSAIGQTSTGQIVNLLSTDMTRIDGFFTMIPFPFAGFSLLVYAIFKLWKYLAYYTFFGVIFLSFILPFQSLIGSLFSRMRLKAAEFTDERLRLVDEFINAIKIIKFYTWENQFAEKINDARKKEIDEIKKSLYIYSLTTGLFVSTTKIVVYIILVTFYMSGGLISDKIVFITLSVFNQVTFIIAVLVPHFIICSSNFWISIKRINKFLTLEEKHELQDDQSTALISNDKNSVELKPITMNETIKSIKKEDDGQSVKEYDLSIDNLTACFSVIEGVDKTNFLDDKASNSSPKDVKPFDALKNINFNCKPNELLIVVGPVGSGKSSLLQTILSELRIRKGSIEVNGKVSYACQEPWTFAGTVRENILFDSEYDQEKYDEVIKVCSLERDISLFPDADKTFIGERGIALSGGQKARINLARALYFDADIYLLDDSLSAVDTHVCKNIFEKAIFEFLKLKTVILVTHQLNYIKYADKILFIKEGEQILFDESKKVMKKLADEPESDFAKFMCNNIGIRTNPPKQQSQIGQDSSKTNSSLTLEPIIFEEEYKHNQLKEIKKMEKERRLQEEDDQVRFVYKAYVDYFKYGKISFWGPILTIFFGAAQFFGTSCDLFLKRWSDLIKVSDPNSTANGTVPDSSKINEFLNELIVTNGVYLYSGLIVCFFVLCLVRSVLHSVFSMKVSVNIHNTLFKRIVRAQMKFFYDNSVGVVLNRFSRDISMIDDDLPLYFHDFFEIIFIETVVIFVMVCSNAFLVIPFFIFIILVIIYRTFYIRTGRPLETLEGVGKSPIIQHLSSTLNGLSTVRAFKTEEKFIKKFNRYQNDHTAIHFMVISAKRWFGYVLDNLQLIFVSGSLLVLILFAENFSGSLIGLIVTYILMFNGEFQWGIICWSNLETCLCSVDRIERMGINLDSGKSLAEPPLESTEDAKPPDNWPQKGVLEFRSVTMRYYENENPVLKNLNFTIEQSDKIGIVGRTGAGKSSIVAALFRLTEYEGEILIDDINCKSIGLHDLRGRISIIPQDPVLFTGTVRSNLDPIGVFEDYRLWDALNAVQLEQEVKKLEGGLDSKVIDNGGNFSVGQKQLICLARAILKENKILVLDEATANCDPKTDELIQNTIRTVFKHCTILTIAHRLNTIMDSTKILVLDAGEIREYDTPFNLLQDKTSLFSSMVDACGQIFKKI